VTPVHDPVFAFGAQYYRVPGPPPEDWARDLHRMREHGCNAVRFWASWSWVHRAPGSFDFADLDRLMDLAAEAGLRVLINVILENAPSWLDRAAPEARYVAHDGQAVTLNGAINTPGGGWPGLCFDNVAVREAAEAYLRAVVARYRDHPALAWWDVWNEPHLEPTWSFPDKLFCYCPGSLARFDAWLRERYRDLDSLNRAWARRFTGWHEVAPPRARETFPDLLDWREFWLRNLGDWLAWRARVVREADPGHPVLTHVASSAYLGTLTKNVWDEWLLSDPVDVYGTSSFPRWLMGGDPVVHLFHLEATRAAARGKPFWQSELEGGRGRREGLASAPHPSPGEVRMWIWNAIATGAKGVLFWQWRPERLGPESPGYGLCTPAGEPSGRTAAAAEMAALIDRFGELRGSVPVDPRVGLVVSRKAALLADASEQSMDVYAQALLGAYRAFTDHDVPVELVHEDQLAAAGVPAHLDALYWPLPQYLEAPVARALEAFVARGGRLVAETSPGQHVEGTLLATRVPSHGLDRLFGAVEVESDTTDRVTVKVGGFGGVQGAWLTSEFRPAGGTPAGSFDDGAPAVVHNQHGEGTAVLVATLPSLAYEQGRDPATGRWIAACGDPDAARDPARGLLTRVHRHRDGVLVFALNWGADPVATALPAPDAALAFDRASDGIRALPGDGLAVDLPPLHGAVAVLRRRDQPRGQS
jgi:beta-galactosidase GanA